MPVCDVGQTPNNELETKTIINWFSPNLIWNVTKICRLNVGRKWTILNRYISVITNIDEKWFVIFEHNINCLSFGYVHLPQLEYYFSFFPFFFFILLLRLSTFKPLYVLYLKFERLKISGRTSTRLKLGVPGWGNPPRTGPPKFWTFKPLKLDESNFQNG